MLENFSKSMGFLVCCCCWCWPHIKPQFSIYSHGALLRRHKITELKLESVVRLCLFRECDAKIIYIIDKKRKVGHFLVLYTITSEFSTINSKILNPMGWCGVNFLFHYVGLHIMAVHRNLNGCHGNSSFVNVFRQKFHSKIVGQKITLTLNFCILNGITVYWRSVHSNLVRNEIPHQ